MNVKMKKKAAFALVLLKIFIIMKHQQKLLT